MGRSHEATPLLRLQQGQRSGAWHEGGGGGRAHVAEYGAARAKSFHSGYSTIGILVCATVTSHVVCRAEVAQGWMTVEEVA